MQYHAGTENGQIVIIGSEQCNSDYSVDYSATLIVKVN